MSKPKTAKSKARPSGPAKKAKKPTKTSAAKPARKGSLPRRPGATPAKAKAHSKPTAKAKAKPRPAPSKAARKAAAKSARPATRKPLKGSARVPSKVPPKAPAKPVKAPVPPTKGAAKAPIPTKPVPPTKGAAKAPIPTKPVPPTKGAAKAAATPKAAAAQGRKGKGRADAGLDDSENDRDFRRRSLDEDEDGFNEDYEDEREEGDDSVEDDDRDQDADVDADYDEDDDDEPESERPVRRGSSRSDASAKAATPPAPSIPLPVKELPRIPTLEERAASIEQRLSRQSDEFRRAYDEGFDMSWVFHDTGLEGVIYTFEELQSAFKSIEVAHLDSSIVPIFHAIKRNQDGIAFVREMADKKKLPITVDVVRKLYVTLHPDEGDVKSVRYRRDVPQHRLYFHEYAAPDKIALKLRALVDWANEPDAMKALGPLKLAAKFHYDLARIYPFPKDSGKVARLLMNLMLMRAGYPPAIMHHSERQRYYDALKAPSASTLVQMVRDAVENSISSIEKLLDDRDLKARTIPT